jgi:hypothetical protein
LLAEKQNAREETKTATSMMRASRDWLENCLKLYSMLEYEDERLKDHADELLKDLNGTLGPATEEDEEDDDGWEDEDEGGDAAMLGT